MRIAVSAMGRDLDADLDPRFGRAMYFLILDPNGTIEEVIENSTNMNAMKGAGIQAGKILADKKVDVLLTGHCGPNAFKALNAAGIKVAVELSGTVREALERFKRTDVKFAGGPNVEGHW
ncbi:MAG: NifB/NifX family molybdenum-iron cluster-binding protein [Desulfomonilaceae bacterium]|nr:NifB/NifX family molybdenum-iron cluster-binding protein [Desulfomonilaceae bacterium]